MQTIQQEVVQANIEALTQGKMFLTKLTPAQYVQVCAPYTSSTIGEHMRHVLDMYSSLMESGRSGLVNYDNRARGSSIEHSTAAAIDAIDSALFWLSAPDENQLASDVTIRSEVRLESTVSVKIRSSFVRELVFVSSHTVHHYALIAVIARLQNIELPAYFGVAPATVTFLRHEVACAP